MPKHSGARKSSRKKSKDSRRKSREKESKHKQNSRSRTVTKNRKSPEKESRKTGRVIRAKILSGKGSSKYHSKMMFRGNVVGFDQPLTAFQRAWIVDFLRRWRDSVMNNSDIIKIMNNRIKV